MILLYHDFMAKYNLEGKVIEGLTVLKLADKQKRLWLIRCMCGKEFIKNTSWFKHSWPKIKSCGCKKFTEFHNNTKVGDPKEVSFKSLYKRNRNAAKHNGKSWDIDIDLFRELSFSNCHYCEAPPVRKYNVYVTQSGAYTSKHVDRCDKAWIEFNGIDRIDSSIGYRSDNVVPACRTCNFAKNDLPYNDFIEWLKQVAKIWKNK